MSVLHRPSAYGLPSSAQNAVLMGEDGRGGLFEVPCIVTSLVFEHESAPVMSYSGGYPQRAAAPGPMRFTLEAVVRDNSDPSAQIMGIEDQRRAQEAMRKMQAMLDNRLSALKEIEQLVNRPTAEWSSGDVLAEIQNVFETTNWEDPIDNNHGV